MFVWDLNLEIFLQLRMLGLLLSVFVVFAAIAIGSLLIDDFEVRHLIVGFLSCAALISMFASPLFIIVSFLEFATLLGFLMILYGNNGALLAELGDPNKKC